MKKKCGLIIFFLLKILAKQFILKNNETVENLHKMYIDSGLFFHWIHLPITTQHINHLCVSDAFFKGTFHKYKPTNKFFWTCIVKIDNHSTSYLASAQCEDNINMNTISWSVILTLLYKKPPKELRSENIQISSQIWQSTEKENLFFFGLDDKMLHIWNYHLVFITDSKKRGLGFKISVSTTLCDPMLTNGMQKLEIKRKKNSVCSKKSPADDKDSKSLHLDLNYSHIKHNFVNIKTIKRCKHKKFTTKKLSNCISCTEWGKLYVSCVPFVESIGTRTSALHLECGPLFYDK